MTDEEILKKEAFFKREIFEAERDIDTRQKIIKHAKIGIELIRKLKKERGIGI